MSSPISRRSFLRGAMATAFGGSRLGATLFALGGVPLAAAGGNDARALVCINLAGGNDGFNMLVPAAGKARSVYESARGSMALPASSCLDLPDGKFQAHPSLAPLAELYGQGRVALLANVGTLTQPTSKADYLAGCPLPPSLFSHNDQADQWLACQADAKRRVGWAGRVADLFSNYNASLLPLNVSLAETNAFQAGEMTSPYVMSPDGPMLPKSLLYQDSGDIYLQLLAQAQQAGPFEQYHADVSDLAIEFNAQVGRALDAAPACSVSYPGTPIGQQLQMIARMISVRGTLGASRQIFYANFGSFDTHDEQLERHAERLTDLAEALRAFQQHLDQLGVADSVVAFTTSDFGRTVTSNGDGTDHGWGSVHMILGGAGAVRGGAIYGRYPDLTRDGPDDAGNGRIIPTASVEQYAATMLRWFGGSEAQLDEVFPNLRRFASRDLGFMSV